MRSFRFALLASAAVVFAACNDGVVAPGGPTIAGSPSTPSLNPFFTAATDTAVTDSVAPGYGCHATGGLEYECFEYEPCTGTEYVVCPDTTGGSNDPGYTDSGSTGGTTGGTSGGTTGGTSGGTSGGSTGGTSGGTTGGTNGGTTAPQDSVVSGYGSESTGGIDYDRFEYDPETGTEPVVTSDPDDSGN